MTAVQIPEPGDSRVGLAGDWHGNSSWARRALRALADRGISQVFHLGDFGIWPGPRGRQYVSEIEGALRGLRQRLYLTPGNHEDYAQIGELPALDDGIPWLTDHIGVLPRGARWTLAGRTWVSLGGAPSVDYPNRVEGKSWWPEEAITDEDVGRVIAGGHAEVMLCHDAPAPGTPAVARIVRARHPPWTREALRYAAEGRARLIRAYEAVQPALLAHGHYHVQDEALVAIGGTGRECQTLSLACEWQVGNVVVLDLTEPVRVAWEWVDVATRPIESG